MSAGGWRQHAAALRRIVGRMDVLDSPVALSTYAGDATPVEGRADLVVFPSSTEEVAAVARYCSGHGLAMTARGSGTDLSGGAVPHGGVVVTLTRMNRIISIDANDRLAVVQPGVVNVDLQKALDAVGMIYAPDPASQKVCSLGGNVGKGAGGLRGFKYGVTRDHVAGLKVVLAGGDTVDLGGRCQPPGPELDWMSLLIGSEGTLGLVTEITVKVLPKPAAARTFLAVFDSLGAAGDTVSEIVAQGIVPSALELMDQVMMGAVEAYCRVGLPTDAAASLLIEVDGPAPGLERQGSLITAICRRNGARSVRAATSAAERDALWLARRVALGAAARVRPTYDLEDITVPRGRLTEMLGHVTALATELNLTIGMLAHAGDGNLHPLILFDERDPAERQRVQTARRELFRQALALGGTLSGEHGIGLLKKEFMPWLYSAEALRAMAAVKAAFDPLGLLNPRKVIPDEFVGAAHGAGAIGQSGPVSRQAPPAVGGVCPGGDAERLRSEVESLLGPVVTDGPGTAPAPARNPLVWAQPKDPRQVAELLAWATSTGTPVYPFGGGTKWSQGLAPFSGGVGLDLGALRAPLDLDAANLTITAGAGVTIETLRQALAPHRFFYPPESAHPNRSTLGGQAASNEGGPATFGYGWPRAYVLGVKACFPSGLGGAFGGKPVKNASGYDLARFLCGSWGALGVITELTLKVLPLPECSTALAFLGPPAHALGVAEAAAGGLPDVKAVVVLEGEAAGRFREAIAPGGQEAGAALVVRLGGTPEDALEQRRWLERTGVGSGLTPCLAGDGAAEDDFIWQACRQAAGELGSPPSRLEAWDLAVPPSALGEVLAELDAVAVDAHFGVGRARVWFERSCSDLSPEGGLVSLAQLGGKVTAAGGRLAPVDGGLARGPREARPRTRGLDPVWARLKAALDPSAILCPAGLVGGWPR